MSLPDNAQNEAIVLTTIKLAHSLGLEVVAEGVENEGALRLLAGAGCEQAKGYLLSKPLSPKDFGRWLVEYKPLSYADRRTGARPFRKGA